MRRHAHELAVRLTDRCDRLRSVEGSRSKRSGSTSLERAHN